MKNSIDLNTGNEPIIRFVPKNNLPDDPVNRMRCDHVIEGLKMLGCDADVLHDGEACDVLIVLSLDFDKWLPRVSTVQEQGGVVIFDLSDNEFRRRAEITVKKVKGVSRYIKNPKTVIQRGYYFMRRRRLDKRLDQMVQHCDAVVTSTIQIMNDVRKYNTNVRYIPDIIDFNSVSSIKQHAHTSVPTVVWIGMPNNTLFLEEISGAFSRLQKDIGLHIHVITNPNTYELFPDLDERLDFEFELVPWDLETLAAELCRGDIAIAPLPNGVSKSINKIATYWMANLPAVVTSCEDYEQLVDHEQNGFFARSEEDWYTYIKRLAEDVPLRERVAMRGRKKVLASFTLQAIADQWKEYCYRIFREQSRPVAF